MDIHFQIEYKTQWGEKLYLYINLNDGSQLCLEMDNDGMGNWFTDYRIEDDEFNTNKDITYYYTVQVNGNIIRQEEGSLHTIPYKNFRRIVLIDRWHEYSGLDTIQRSIVLPYVELNGHPRWRGAGTSVPVFSLRTENSFGIGEFTDLTLLVDWAAATGQSIIQILPVNDTTMTRTWRDSYPYSANSSFALNPIYINLEQVGELSDKDFLQRIEKLRKELNALPEIDYERVLAMKTEYLERLYEEFGDRCAQSAGFKDFHRANRSWLEPYAIYCYLRDQSGTVDFTTWKEPVFKQSLIKKYCLPGNPKCHEVRKYAFIQYHLHLQLAEVKRYANSKGILLKGDVPIGVNRYSTDVWVNPKLFNIDCQAGAPPDDFAVDGQKWGMPTYNWKNMSLDGYSWFKERFKKMADYFDAYRIDHLLGFFRIWEIPLKYSSGLMGTFNPSLPYGANELKKMGFPFDASKHAIPKPGTPETEVLFLEDTRIPDHWHPRVNGFNTKLFKTLSKDEQQAYYKIHNDFFYVRNNKFWSESAMVKLSALIETTDMLVCGEDLGMIPVCVPEVMDLLRILTLEVQRMPKQYGVSVANPATYPYLSVCTTSTHDMSVLRVWIEDEMKPNPVISTNEATTDACSAIITSHLASPSMFAIFPIQDWLSIDKSLRARNPESERINVPADPDNYWRYRMHITLEKLIDSDKFNSEIKHKLYLSDR